MAFRNPTRQDIALILLSFVLPWITVGIQDGFCSLSFLIAVVLTICFHFPATIYAIWVVLSGPERVLRRGADVENGHGCADHCHRGYAAVDQYPDQAPIQPFKPAQVQPASSAPSSSQDPPAYQEGGEYAAMDNKVQR